MKLDLTYFELSAIAQALALLAERISEPAHSKHASAVESIHEKLVAIAAENAMPEAKA